MKKILISDYDSTYFTNEENIKNNNLFIKKFIKENIFVIATSRSLDSINKEIIKYNIPFNYLITSNGAIISNDKNNILNIIALKEKQIKFVKQNLNSFNDVKIFESKIDNKIIGYKLKSNNIESLIKIKNKLDKNIINEKMYTELGEPNKLFINNNVNKTDGIKKLLNILNYNDNEHIYTIGDGDQDLEMLKEYNGYRMKNSSDNIKKYIKTYVNEFSEIEKIIT